MWELDYTEIWKLKNWCFWTVVLEKTLESPLDCRRSNQSVLKEISPEYSSEGLLLKLKLQYFGHLIWRTDSLERKPWCWERWKAEREGTTANDMAGWHYCKWLWVWASCGSWWWTRMPGMLQSLVSQRVRHDWATELNWQPDCNIPIRSNAQTRTSTRSSPSDGTFSSSEQLERLLLLSHYDSSSTLIFPLQAY